MKHLKSLIAIVALLAFTLSGAVAAQDHKKNKAKNKAKPAAAMKAGKARGPSNKHRYKVTPQNHGQYVKQLRMASKRLKDLMKGKGGKGKGKGKKAGGNTLVVNNTILEVAHNIDSMLHRIERTKNSVELAAIDLHFMLQQQQQTLQTLSNVSKSHHDASLEIILQIGF